MYALGRLTMEGLNYVLLELYLLPTMFLGWQNQQGWVNGRFVQA